MSLKPNGLILVLLTLIASLSPPRLAQAAASADQGVGKVGADPGAGERLAHGRRIGRVVGHVTTVGRRVLSCR